MSYWVHNWDPFIIRFPESWFFQGIRWYGMAYVAAFAIALLLLSIYRRHQKTALTPEDQGNLIFYLMFGVLMGGRLGYMCFYEANFWASPWESFKGCSTQISGMSSHGGFIGATLALGLFCWRYKQSFWHIADMLFTIAPIGICLGRIANFINGELWGTVTTVPWAIVFPQSAPYIGYPIERLLPRHPSQLYEAGLEGLLLAIYLQWRFWNTAPRPGVLACEGLVLYAIARIIAEQFREPDAPLLWGLSRGIFYSIFLGIAGLMGWIYHQNSKKN
jgi:phosphatidylglycerol:prolipoprotein diacylglycerol transferase